MSSTKTRAILIERHGGPEAMTEREVALPELGPTDVHLQVHAAGVNFADLLMRAGLYGTVPPRPYSPGFEVAGAVVRTGSAVKGWREGDEAVALLRYGGYARDVVVPAAQLFGCPDSITATVAAAVPVNFLTAWVCLFDAGRARQGEVALVLGAAGGVGTAAVQLTLDAGLRAVGTAGAARKRAFVTEELGAEACFDSGGTWESEVRDYLGDRAVDLALDPVGGAATRACRRLLAPLGRVVFYGLSEAMPKRRRSWPRAAWAWLRTPRFHPLSLVEPNIGIFGVHLLHLGAKEEAVLRPALKEIYDRVTEGRIRPVVDRTFPLDRSGAVAAHEHLHGRRAIGKVVLAKLD